MEDASPTRLAQDEALLEINGYFNRLSIVRWKMSV
jgi:hypothetical protein